jgi:hypothetical protein
MLHKALGDDFRHELISLTRSLATLALQGQGERRSEVLRVGGRQFIVGHPQPAT